MPDAGLRLERDVGKLSFEEANAFDDDRACARDANRKRAALARAIGKDVRLVSGVSGAGVRELVNEIAAMLRARRAVETQEARPSDGDWAP